MKKLKLFLTTILLLFVLAFTGCQGKASEPTIDDKSVFEEELMPLTEEELAKMDENADFDEEMTPVDEAEFDNQDAEPTDGGKKDSEKAPADKETSGQKPSDDGGSGSAKVKEDGTYTSKDDVAVYIHMYGHLPSNYITKKEAQKLGWVSKEGNLDEAAPGKSIGGDKFGNYEKMLPEEEGRKYFECDIDFDGKFRNGKRIIYSNDGLVFYTEDHYKTFEQLY